MAIVKGILLSLIHIFEVAARNLMLKQQGYNAVEELEKRMFARLEKTAARAEKIGGE